MVTLHKCDSSKVSDYSLYGDLDDPLPFCFLVSAFSLPVPCLSSTQLIGGQEVENRVPAILIFAVDGIFLRFLLGLLPVQGGLVAL